MVLSSRVMRNTLLLAALTLAVIAVLLARGLEQRGAPADPARAALLTSGRAVVVSAVADLYARPEEGSSLADQALLGHTVTVVAAAPAGGPFVQVETIEQYRGWVRPAALTPLPPGAPPYADGGPAATVRSRFANVYAEPDVTKRNPLLVAPLGVRLRLLGEVDARWLQLVLPDGRRGFVQRGDVDLGEAGRPSAGCVLEEALRHEGTPYLWGGRSTFGVDCSGLSANAYRACGLVIPRDADLQHGSATLRPVTPPEVRPGDLLFFGSVKEGAPAGSPPRVTHVGLFLGGGAGGGGDEFVHATTSERPTVHRSHLSDAAWQRILVGIRRHPALVQ
jgi:gamma-D-glutamyl-L-lysine dipeptidyl-peptidase